MPEQASRTISGYNISLVYHSNFTYICIYSHCCKTHRQHSSLTYRKHITHTKSYRHTLYISCFVPGGNTCPAPAAYSALMGQKPSIDYQLLSSQTGRKNFKLESRHQFGTKMHLGMYNPPLGVGVTRYLPEPKQIIQYQHA